MILEAIISLMGTFLQWVLNAIFLPIPGPAPEVEEAILAVGDVWLLLHSFDSWLPVDFTFAMVGVVLGVTAVSLGIGMARTILSYFTFGGGAR